MKLHRILCAASLFLLATACAADDGAPPDAQDPGPQPSPSDALSAAQAEAAFNEAVLLALGGAPGVTVTRTDEVVELEGTVILGAGEVTFDGLSLAKRPFAPIGWATLASAGQTAELGFTGSLQGSFVLDGEAAGNVTAAFPMTGEFTEAAADWAIDQALAPGTGFANPCPNLTVTDNGNGSFTIDGDCAAGGATIEFDMVTIDVANMAVNGTITLSDGNGNSALIEFAGATFDVTVNGTLVLDDQPIFGILGP